MKIEPKRKYITDREEPSYDIRNIIPEVVDEIQIIGDVSKIMNEKQFYYLRDNHRVEEIGCVEDTQYIKLQNLFTLADIENKIKEICEENK